jgi:hypothetical protein
MKSYKDAVRTEILRVRFAPDDDDRFRKFCNSLGIARATFAYRLAMDAMHAHVRPRHRPSEEASHRPLRTRKRMFPGAQARAGGAPTTYLRV